MSKFAFEKKRHLAAFLQISIYEPFNILSDKMLIVPLGIWDTVTRNEMACPFKCENQLGWHTETLAKPKQTPPAAFSTWNYQRIIILLS